MNIGIYLIFLYLGVLLSGIAYSKITTKRNQWTAWLSIFGGAFLFAICFIHLLPEVYRWGNEHDGASESVKIAGVAVLFGFVLQLLLENLGGGHEQAHFRSAETSAIGKKSALLFLIGLCIHAFLEGMALIHDNHVETGMFYGVLVHNIPLSMVLMMHFLEAGYKNKEALWMLSIFGIAGPLGALFGNSLTVLQPYYHLILAVVIGILLHVASAILYFPKTDKGERYSFFLAIISAFVLVLLIPEHVHS